MKILLVYPTKLDEHGKPIKYRKAFLPPLSLATIAALTPQLHEVTIVNDLVEEIDYSENYDVVGITSMTSQIERAYQIADCFRSMGKKVIIGGMHATVLPDETREHADIVVVGEVENIWEQILDDIEKNQYRELYRDSEFPDLQKLVTPDFNGFNMRIYPRPIGHQRPMMPIFTTRGCPYNCDFCSVSRYFGKSYRVKPIANVLKEIDSINAQYYFFVDDNIVGNPDYSRELFRALTPKGIRWFSQASTTILRNPDLIDLAAKSGCDALLLGIESISEDSLRSVHKSFNDIKQYTELFARLRNSGIVPHVSMIFGFDGDTQEQLNSTIEFLMKNKVGMASFFLLTPLPGTKIFERLREEGRLLHQKWSLFDLNHVVFEPKNFSIDELSDNFWNAFKDFFSFRNIIKRTFYDASISNHPIRGFFEDIFYQMFYRKIIGGRQHPMSGGLGRVSS